MPKTIAVSFDSYEAAQQAARDLQQHGYEQGDISVVAGNDASQFGSEGQLPISSKTSSDGSVGALQVLIDRLIGEDVADAHVHADAVRRGGALVTVKVDDDRAEEAARILRGEDSIEEPDRAEAPRKERRISIDSGADWKEQIGHFRSVHRVEYGGADFDEFEPAYHYGWDVGSDERFRDHSWSDFESAMRVDWERRYPDGEWGRVRRAVQRGWDRAREVVEDALKSN